MKFQKACYSISKLNEAADMVKEITWSVKKKNEHFAKYMEIEKVFAFASEHVNRFLFDPDIELCEYRKAAYYCGEYTAEQLNAMLHRAHRYICNELNDILSSIRSGEVDYCE